MKRIISLFLAAAFLSGCAAYRFQKGQPPYDKGYVASRDDYVIPEYTLGENNTVPKIKLAKERFARRKYTVEDYYKKMGYIENHFKMAFWDPIEIFWALVGGVFWMPVLAVNDWRYEHNPQYRARVDRLEAEKDRREAERIKKLKTGLNAYILKDLAKNEKVMPPPAQPVPAQPIQETIQAPQAQPAPAEKPVEPKPIPKEKPTPPKKEIPVAVKPAGALEVAAPKKEIPVEKTAAVPEMPAPKKEPVPEAAAAKKEPVPEVVRQELDKQETFKAKAKPEKIKPAKPKPVKIKQPPKVKQPKEKIPKPLIKREVRVEAKKEAAAGPQAVIVARPANGYSPLRVHFSGIGSSAPRPGRIVSYLWDFGDGDTSARPNPVNTFYSGESLPQHFTVTLTVQDDLGNTAQAQAVIEVLNR